MVRWHLPGWYVKYSFWGNFEERENNDDEGEREKEEYY